MVCYFSTQNAHRKLSSFIDVCYNALQLSLRANNIHFDDLKFCYCPTIMYCRAAFEREKNETSAHQ